MSEIGDLQAFREKVKRQREREWIRDALRLRDRGPEATIRTMFDLVKSAEEMGKAKKCEP